MRADPLSRELTDRVAFVTGGAVRLGRATVEGLLARGARVAFTYRGSKAEATQVEAAAAQTHGEGRALALKCDVRHENEVEAAFDAVRDRWGAPDLLVNNAAIFGRTPIDTISLEAWQRHIDVNLTGTFLCARRAGRDMAAGRGGVIVNVACAGGVRPWPGHLAYSVSKAGVIMLTQVLARALAPKVRVNAIAPGPVLLPEDYDDEQAARAIAATVLQRKGSPDDVVRAILFCWDSDFTTGALIPVEGGRLVL